MVDMLVFAFDEINLFDLETYQLRRFDITWDYANEFVICARPVTVDEIEARE
jgi:hypothetical protein